MQESLSYFGDVFNKGFGLNGLKSVVASIEAINGQAMGNLGLGGAI